MGVLLDTADVPALKRAGVISEAIRYASAPCDVVHSSCDDAWARMAYTDFGSGVSVYSHSGSGIRLVRRPHHLSLDSQQRVGLAIHRSAVGGMLLGDDMRQLESQELLLVDLTMPYEYFWAGTGRADCFQVDYDTLGLPVDLIRAAAGRLQASPLYDMVRGHIDHVTRNVDALSANLATASSVGAATTLLVAALVASAADEGNLRNEALAMTLEPRILHWLRNHLLEDNVVV